MITKTVPMAVLERVLQQLGYVKQIIPNPHGFTAHAFAFTNSQEKGALLLMPMYQAEEQVALMNLVAAQVTVDNWGIADRSQFEQLLAECAQQSSSTNAAPAATVA